MDQIIEEEDHVSEPNSPTLTSALELAVLRCQELRSVWDGVQLAWASLLEAEENAHYDSLQREELTVADEQLAVQFPSAVLSVLEAAASSCIDLLLREQQLDGASSDAMLLSLRQHLLQELKKLDACAPIELRNFDEEVEVAWLTAEALASQAAQAPVLALAAHVWLQTCFHMHATESCFTAICTAMPLDSVLCSLSLPSAVPASIPALWASLADSFPHLLPDSLQVAQVCHAQRLGAWAIVDWGVADGSADQLLDPAMAVEGLQCMARAARVHSSAFLEVSCRLRLFNWHCGAAATELGALQEDRAMGLTSAARELCESLFLACDFAKDPLAVCGGDASLLSKLEQKQSFALFEELQHIGSQGVESLLLQLHATEQSVLQAATDAAPEALLAGPRTDTIHDVDEFLCGLHDVEDWGALLSAACQLSLDNQQELTGRHLPKGTAAEDILNLCQSTVNGAAQHLQEFSRFRTHPELRDRYAECASQLSALQSGLRLQHAALLKADGKHEEIAQYMEKELEGLLDGTDAIVRLQREAGMSEVGAEDESPEGEQHGQLERLARLERKQKLSRARQSTLFGLRCSTAWATLEKWENAERVILSVASFLATLQADSGIGANRDLSMGDLQREFELLPLEVAVLQSMAWTQLARALRAQGQEEKYAEIVQSKVLGMLGEHILQHGAILQQNADVFVPASLQTSSATLADRNDTVLRASTLACAVYHTAQQAMFSAIEEFLKPRPGLNSVESLFQAYSKLDGQSAVIRQWSALAELLASHCDNLRSIGGTAASKSHESETVAAASSPVFIWQLPSSAAQILTSAAQVEFWSGKLMQHSAYFQTTQTMQETPNSNTEEYFKLREETLSHELSPLQCQNLDVALWHFQQALEQSSLLSETDGTGLDQEPALWCFECAHLYVQELVRAASIAADPLAGAATVQANADWVAIESLCRRVLQAVTADIYDANPRLQLAVAGLQRHQTMALCHTQGGGVEHALEYGVGASKRTHSMMLAAMKSLHLLEDQGTDEVVLARVGRSVLLLQQMTVAHMCDLALIAAAVHGAERRDGENIHGNKVGQLFTSALQSAEAAARYRGIETAYPDSVLCGFPVLTWRPQLQVFRSHVQTLLQTVFDTAFSCVDYILGSGVWSNDAASHSSHKVLRSESELLFSLEGAVEGKTTFAYTSGPSADAAFLRSRIAKLQSRSNAPSFLMCAGLLHKLAVWLETQQGFATASPASRPSYFNTLFVAGNIFRLVGNESGEQRSRRKAVEALRQAIEYYSDRLTTLADAQRQLLIRNAREALAVSLDELGMCLMGAQLFLPALEAFMEGRDVRVVLYTSTAGESAHSAKFNNSHYIWVTLSGIIESSLRCQRYSMAVDIAQEQLQLLGAAGASDSFWSTVSTFAWGRALLRQGYLEDGYAKLKETSDLCHALRDSVNDATCWFDESGTRATDTQPVVWGSPGALYANFKPPGVSPARFLFDVQLRCLWQMAEAARSMFRLPNAVQNFQQWHSISQQEQDFWDVDPISPLWVTPIQAEAFDVDSVTSTSIFVRDVERASVSHGLAAAQIQLGNADDAMDSLQRSREQHLQTQGMLSMQYTACVVDIARHFLTYSSDPGGAIDFLQHPLGLLYSCLNECRRRQGHSDSDSDSTLSDSDDSDAVSLSAESDDEEFSTGIFVKGTKLVGAPIVGGDLTVLEEAEEEEDESSSDDEAGSNGTSAVASPKRSKASEMLQRAQLIHCSGVACLRHLRQSCLFKGASIASVLEGLIPPAPVDIDAAEAVDWQLQLGGTMDDMALHILTMQLQRQIAAILYHIGLALALEGGLPHPPQPLDTFDDISVKPREDLAVLWKSRHPEADNAPQDENSDDDPLGAEEIALQAKARSAAAAWYQALHLELQVRSASTKGEFTPSITALKSIARLGQLLHAATADTDAAIGVLSFGCRWLLQFSALASTAERNVAPVLWICLSACKAHVGDFHGSAAAGGLCIDGLRNAKSDIDERDGVDLMSAMQSMSLMAQYECLALCFQARVYLEQDMPDTALACLRAADRTLQQYTSASSPHSARILYWDTRIVSIQRALAELYDAVGDAVKAEQVAATAVQLESEREAEGDAVTAAVAAAAREGLW